MTDTIQRLRELMVNATPGPWNVDACGDAADIWSEHGKVAISLNASSYCMRTHDAALIVAAINALPAMIEVCEAAKKVDQQAFENHDGTDHWSVPSELMDALCKALQKLEGA